MSDPISGSAAGWLGVGLLATLLAWLLFKHIPEKDRQTNGLLESRDRVMREQLHTQRESFMHRHGEVMEEVRDIRRQFAAALATQAEIRKAVEVNGHRIYEWTKVLARMLGQSPPLDPSAKAPPPQPPTWEMPAVKVDESGHVVQKKTN